MFTGSHMAPEHRPELSGSTNTFRNHQRRTENLVPMNGLLEKKIQNSVGFVTGFWPAVWLAGCEPGLWWRLLPRFSGFHLPLQFRDLWQFGNASKGFQGAKTNCGGSQRLPRSYMGVCWPGKE